jgi:hypothetical protein
MAGRYGAPVGDLIARHLGGFVARHLDRRGFVAGFVAQAAGAAIGPANFVAGFVARLLPLAIGPVLRRPVGVLARPAALTLWGIPKLVKSITSFPYIVKSL